MHNPHLLVPRSVPSPHRQFEASCIQKTQEHCGSPESITGGRPGRHTTAPAKPDQHYTQNSALYTCSQVLNPLTSHLRTWLPPGLFRPILDLGEGSVSPIPPSYEYSNIHSKVTSVPYLQPRSITSEKKHRNPRRPHLATEQGLAQLHGGHRC